MNIKITDLQFHDDRCLVQPADEKMTAGGIIIPDTKDEKPTYGTIVILGEWDEEGRRCPWKKGDQVLYGKYAGTEVDLIDENGKERTYLIIRMRDLIATIHNNKKK